MAKTKEQLRAELSSRRQALSAKEAKDLSNLIAVKALENINWKDIKSINVYSAIEKWREVNPDSLVAALKSGLPYLKVTALSKSKEQPKSKKKYDAIIVPMLGFDKNRHRLGMGGGFYDKFLAKQTKALKIGLCYGHGLLESLPNEKHDIPLDIIITEGIIITRESHFHKNRKNHDR